ncbi:MAG: hypothetical protein AAFQ01_04560, partial [Bacteroidota bacterium]
YPMDQVECTAVVLERTACTETMGKTPKSPPKKECKNSDLKVLLSKKVGYCTFFWLFRSDTTLKKRSIFSIKSRQKQLQTAAYQLLKSYTTSQYFPK